jgi:hypothetical protein
LNITDHSFSHAFMMPVDLLLSASTDRNTFPYQTW